MNTVKIVLLFAAFLIISATTQAQCDASNSPTFQVTTSQATLATYGICGMQINIINAATNPNPGGPLSFSLIAPGQSSIIIQPTPTIATIAGIWTVMVTDNITGCMTSQTVQVTILPAPNLTLVASNTLVCSGYGATLTASGANSYTWNTHATTASISITPATTLTYNVMGTGSNGCANTTSIVISVLPCTRVEELKIQNEELRIFPIPARDFIELKVSDKELWADFNNASIYNQHGQLIKEESISFKEQKVVLRIDELANGVYTIQIRNSRNERITKKLLVVK